MDLVVQGETITTTEDHPYWSITDQRFEPAQGLTPGEQLLTATGQPLTVHGLELTTNYRGLAYNLAITNIHTYHVGTAGVLVHNTCQLPGLAPSAPRPLGLGSTGRTTPANIQEQMAMTSVRNNPAGSPITRIQMSDARWPAADGWVKMQQIEGGVTIHYVYNTVTGAVDDFKFVTR